jgi:hypothetical protein
MANFNKICEMIKGKHEMFHMQSLVSLGLLWIMKIKTVQQLLVDISNVKL